MAVKYIYNGDFGLSIQAEHNAELTEDEAKMVIARDAASALRGIASALADIAQTFEYKNFYDEDAAAAPPRPAKRKATKKRATR